MVDQDVAAAPDGQPRGRPVRAAGAKLGTAVLWLCAMPLLALVVLRLAGIDGNRYTAAALALVPYAAVGGLLLAVAALLFRRWRVGILVLILALTLSVLCLPRVFSSTQPDAVGRSLRVLALNLHHGQADPRTVLNLVRAQDVDVLALAELTPHALSELDAAGLRDLLPYRVASTPGGAAGTGLFTRYPLDERDLTGPSRLAQPGGQLHLPGAPGVQLVAVHPVPPVFFAGAWQEELAGLPDASGDGPVRILLGDFNATLDHAALREVLDTGYVDAAAERGAGLTATWPNGYFPPPVTLDHILVDNRVAVRDYRVLRVPSGDHDAVYAELTLPY